MDRFTAAGIRKTWVFQAFDDEHEVLILQEFPMRRARGMDRPSRCRGPVDVRGRVGAYPPLFVGRFFDMMRIEAE